MLDFWSPRLYGELQAEYLSRRYEMRKIKVVNPERWEATKFCAFWLTLTAAIACLGGLEWEPEMGDPIVPAPELGVFFLITAGFIAWRLGSTTRR